MVKINSLNRSAGIIGGATMVSRILGFLRDIIFAVFFGTGIEMQAFVVAFRIPNLLRHMIAEGAANAAIIPLFAEYKNCHDEKDFWQMAGVVLNFIFLVFVAVTLAGILLTPVIIKVIAPGFGSDKGLMDLTVMLTRVIFPYILLIGLVAYLGGILNTFNVFGPTALGPAFLNLSLILSALFLSGRLDRPVLALAFGVLAGGIAQIAVQIPSLCKRGFRLLGSFRLSHPMIRSIGRLLGPRAVGSAVYQVNILVDTILASLSGIVGQGAIAALYFSNRIFQLPLAIFAISFAQAALPKMSHYASTADIPRFKETILFSLKKVFFFTIPASVGIFALSGPITKVIFEHGEFSAYSTFITSRALLFYSLGLVWYSGVKVVTNVFYSMKDTRTPLKISVLAMLVNISFNLMLMYPLKAGGLALATSIAGLVNFIFLFAILNKKINGLNIPEIAGYMAKVFAASAVMGIYAWFLSIRLFSSPASSSVTEALSLTGLIASAAFIFFISSLALDIGEAKGILRWISRRG
ncbi:MAG: murein biosynthesis integral membrane protein MurJ [Candidatus Omnitrophica bacterium CG1_02_49_10]|nr:MAG: murein biosynthesis integral membrane protein MurJ [Candidatus Omnitrophica bacterium CG1_02_49_10]